jgi:hypothetical protein
MSGNSSQIEINKRERLQCERDIRNGKPIVRILRLKPNASGALRAAGPQIEFSAKHLPGLISMLQALQDQITRQSRAEEAPFVASHGAMSPQVSRPCRVLICSRDAAEMLAPLIFGESRAS